MEVQPLFSIAGEAALVEVIARRPLLAFDFDGTLAPIVPDRAAAVMTPTTASLLARVAELYPCAVISG
ncbi:MAG: trehalose-phosphatase, partial [Proteobacteria bacterium]|nr:trehalose-phosphatase [Burkholderiales bacterium]